jgi:hypothetical protein
MGKSAVSTENGAKSRELRSLRHVAYIRKTKKCIQNLIRRPQGKGPFERPMQMWENDRLKTSCNNNGRSWTMGLINEPFS